MRSMKKALIVALALTGTMALAACGNKDEKLTDEPLTGTTIADFTKGEAETFTHSDGWTNGDVFNSFWKGDHVTYSDGAMHLSITDNPNGSEATNDGTFGGEARSFQHYGYGDYSVKMKPARVNGAISTFFTYIGPSEKDENGNPNPHDEIDIEFVGKDTTKVQFNYFVNGVGKHEYMYNLGFDASLEYHEYGFRWTSEYIVWFVDNKPVHKVKASAKNPMPSTPGRILMNYWSGKSKLNHWMGEYKGTNGVTCDYKEVKTSATAIDKLPEKPAVPSDDLWADADAVGLEFTSSNGKHTAATEGTVTTVTYSDIDCDYSNIQADITTSAAQTNWMRVTLRNNDENTTPTVRVNILGENDVCLNAAATMDGKEVFTDLTWGGSFFNNIPAGKDIEAIIFFKGAASKLQFMLDSTHAGDNTKYSGNITISDIKFVKFGDLEQAEPPVTPPEEGDATIKINDADATFVGNLGADGYTVAADTEDNTLTVSYTDLAGASYKNINADVTATARTHNKFAVKMKNNGEQAATIRIDIQSEKKQNNTDACNLSATMNGEAAPTDTEWGGSTFAVPAGATVTAEVTYDTSRGPTRVMFYFDSAVYDDEGMHTGSVVLSEMAFSGEGSYDPNQTEDTDDQSVSLTFTSTEQYTVDKSGEEGKEINVTYTAVTGSTYANIAAQAATLAADKNTFSLKIKNNGEAAVKLRVDLIGENTVTVGDNANMNVCNLSATAMGGSDMYTDTTWGGTMVTLAAGEEITLVITYSNDNAMGVVQRVQVYFDSAVNGDGDNTYSGDVTLSEFKFTAVETQDEE